MATTIFELVATLGLDNSGFLTGLNIAGNMMHAFASSVVDFGKDVMRTGMGFDSAMSSVQAVLGREEGTMENMEKLRAYALDQSRTSIFTAEETANAYYYMGMAGWKAEKMTAGLPAVMSLAAASNEDLAMTSDIVTDSLTAFGKGADYAQTYVDILAQAATNSNTNVAMMGETFKYAAPLAGAMGFSVEDTAVAIGLMANAGIKGSQAGTTLRRVFSAMTGPIDIAGQNLGKVTIQTTNADGSMRDLSDIVTELRGAFAQLTESEKTHAAETIAGKYAMSGFLAMMNATTEDVDKLTDAIENATGAAQTMSEVRLDNLEGDIIKMNSALDILKVAIFDDAKGPAREVVEWATGAINDVTNAVNENGLAGGIDVLGDKIEEAGTKFEPLMESIGKAAGPLVATLIDSTLPRMTEVGAKLGEGLLTSLGESMAGDGGVVSGMSGVIISALGNGVSIMSTVSGWLKDAGTEGGKQAMMEASMQLSGTSSETQDDIERMVGFWRGVFGTAGKGGAEDIAAEIGSSGTQAGNDFGETFQSALSKRKFSVDVAGNIIYNVPVQRNARAMASGRIFTRPTVFGYADNAFQVAGDAGPEAVVGVNSLHNMIAGAVNAAMAGQEVVVPRDTGRDITIILELDRQQFARAIYNANKQETQRVGVQLSGVTL